MIVAPWRRRCVLDIRPVRSQNEISDAAGLMRGLVEANKALYHDDLKTIEEYYRGAWFFDDDPEIPDVYCPPQGDVLIAYLHGSPVGTVATYRMNASYCELKSMFVAPTHRKQGVAEALCDAVINFARDQGYAVVRLTTGIRQTAARRLYEKLGFSIVQPWEADPPEGYDYFELPLFER
jgi:GNAT superfamily N-acetyltransferase